HLLGVGGSGMAPLAILASSRGYSVSGSDGQLSSKKESLLRKAGVALTAENDLPADASTIVFSSAIPESHPSPRLARARRVHEIHRMDFLTELAASKRAQFGVAGTHGKTSTTSMLGWLLLELGFDPDIIAGGRPLYLENGVRAGKGSVAALETDESDGSFLRVKADLRLCLNIDSDHLEYYGTFERLCEAFQAFMRAARSPVVNIDDKNLAALRPAGSITFGEDDRADFRGEFRGQSDSLTVYESGRPVGQIDLLVPGRHFAKNALGAYALVRAAMHHH